LDNLTLKSDDSFCSSTIKQYISWELCLQRATQISVSVLHSEAREECKFDLYQTPGASPLKVRDDTVITFHVDTQRGEVTASHRRGNGVTRRSKGVFRGGGHAPPPVAKKNGYHYWSYTLIEGKHFTECYTGDLEL